jgi:hypothetical protein
MAARFHMTRDSYYFQIATRRLALGACMREPGCDHALAFPTGANLLRVRERRILVTGTNAAPQDSGTAQRARGDASPATEPAVAAYRPRATGGRT